MSNYYDNAEKFVKKFVPEQKNYINQVFDIQSKKFFRSKEYKDYIYSEVYKRLKEGIERADLEIKRRKNTRKYSIEELQKADIDFLVKEFRKPNGKIHIDKITNALAFATHEYLKDSSARDFRKIWYSLLKSILEKIGKYNVSLGGKSEELYKRFNHMMISILLKYGILDSCDYLKEDEARKTKISKFGFGKENIIFIEKNSSYSDIENVGYLYETQAMSSKGRGAVVSVYKFFDRFVDFNKKYHFHIIVDYNYYGFGILLDIISLAIIYGLDFDFTHVGVLPYHIPEEMYFKQIELKSGKNDVRDEWNKLFGIEGKYGYEIEAVHKDIKEANKELRRILAESLNGKIDVEEVLEEKREKSIEGLGKSVASPIIDGCLVYEDKRNQILTKLDNITKPTYTNISSAIILDKMDKKEELDDLNIEEFAEKFVDDDDFDDRKRYTAEDIMEQAVEGYTVIKTPIYNDTFDLKQKIKSAIEEEFGDKLKPPTFDEIDFKAVNKIISDIKEKITPDLEKLRELILN